MDKDKILSMLRRLEFCIDTSKETGKDTYICPICGGSYMPGIGGNHEKDCELNDIIREIER
jgi:hypothetical protein